MRNAILTGLVAAVCAGVWAGLSVSHPAQAPAATASVSPTQAQVPAALSPAPAEAAKPAPPPGAFKRAPTAKAAPGQECGATCDAAKGKPGAPGSSLKNPLF